MSGRTSHAEGLDGAGLRIAVVWARFNEHVTSRLLHAARETLKEHDAEVAGEIDVPGAFELPFACAVLLGAPAPDDPLAAATLGRPRTSIDAVVALGCVIRGETPHFDYVAGECARGLMDVQLAARVPIAFGVLTASDEAQALARAGGEHGNKGHDAALAAIEMARFAREVSDAWAR